LELDQSGRIATSTTNNIKQARTTVGIDSEVDSVIASDIRVIVDIDGGDAIRIDCGRDFRKGKEANLDRAIVTNVGLDPWTSLAHHRPSDVVYCQQAISTVTEE
jgi:hypothetical protein